MLCTGHNGKINHRNDNINTLFLNDTTQAFSITTNPAVLNLPNRVHNITAWPGETIDLPLESLDELGHPTASYVRLKTSTNYEVGFQILPHCWLICHVGYFQPTAISKYISCVPRKEQSTIKFYLFPKWSSG